MGQVIQISPIITSDYLSMEQAGSVLGVRSWAAYEKIFQQKYELQCRKIGGIVYMTQSVFLQCCQDVVSQNGQLFTKIAFLMVEGKLPHFSIIHLAQYFHSENYPPSEVYISLSDIIENQEYLAERHS